MITKLPKKEIERLLVEKACFLKYTVFYITPHPLEPNNIIIERGEGK
jgi:hypothetical protein